MKFVEKQQWLIRWMYQVGINCCWALSNSGKHSNTTVNRICIYICRIPEVIYQPSMLGVEQGGLAETMEFVLASYPSHIQQELANVS